ncbi:hypothetical protein [Hansschlegelia zhihuaiae]|uniref:Uncharacterized protein n=1 Tax=Hansschlegelia zhihuaiae TaxID=405005 RepID=A0A4Q0M9V3_9HYPH|nr:hypothetical protein [Hansschlegelia zhihuaiae]RXF69987.1 hypothetical protein EK403_17840 [Hansschlegelia zhihuaiae]
MLRRPPAYVPPSEPQSIETPAPAAPAVQKVSETPWEPAPALEPGPVPALPTVRRVLPVIPQGRAEHLEDSLWRVFALDLVSMLEQTPEALQALDLGVGLSERYAAANKVLESLEGDVADRAIAAGNFKDLVAADRYARRGQ